MLGDWIPSRIDARGGTGKKWSSMVKVNACTKQGAKGKTTLCTLFWTKTTHISEKLNVCDLSPKDRHRTDQFQARILRTQRCSGTFAMCTGYGGHLRNIMLMWSISCCRHPLHFSQTVGSCKTTYRLQQGGNTSTRWWLLWHALRLVIWPCIKTIWWTWTCLTDFSRPLFASAGVGAGFPPDPFRSGGGAG